MHTIMDAARELGMEIDLLFLEKLKVFEREILNSSKEDKCDSKKRAICEAQFGKKNMEWACSKCEENK